MITTDKQSGAGRRWGRVLLIGGIMVVFIGSVVAYRIHRRIPAGLIQDLRAATAVRNIPDADERFRKYLEGRYGPLADRANQTKAFLDFFNVEHIKSMQFLIKHTPESKRQATIEATARWLKGYRESMSAEERAKLKTQLDSPEGQAMLRSATTQYNSQDVEYRGQTVPVISQLLTTLTSVAKN